MVVNNIRMDVDRHVVTVIGEVKLPLKEFELLAPGDAQRRTGF